MRETLPPEGIATPPPKGKRRAIIATQPEERIQRSLFGEILDWMLAPLLLLWPMSIAITYLIAQSIANQPFDRALEDSVTVLAQQVSEVNGKVVARLPVSARDLLRADDIDNIYFQITGPRGEFIEGDRDMPPPQTEDDKVPLGTVQFRNDICMATTSALPIPRWICGAPLSNVPRLPKNRDWRWCRSAKPWKSAPSSPMKSSRV